MKEYKPPIEDLTPTKDCNKHERLFWRGREGRLLPVLSQHAPAVRVFPAGRVGALRAMTC